jgi:hypothetical protein
MDPVLITQKMTDPTRVNGYTYIDPGVNKITLQTKIG